MKHFRRFSCLLFLCLLVSLFSVFPAHAELDPQDAILHSYEVQAPVDLSQYNIAEEDFDLLFEQVLNSGQLPWYAANTYEISYDQETGKVLRFFPQFLDEEEYDYVRYEQRIQEITADCIREGMSPWQKALAVHDYLIANACYDESITYYEGYDLLVRGTAVCEGYSEAYMDILNRLGIPCQIVRSEDMDHCWNLVELEGSWYHVDVTWDDPSPDHYGNVLHDYFLVTDQEMRDDHLACQEEDTFGHYNWKSDIACTDTTFTDAFWKGIDSQICYPEAAVSYFRRTQDWSSFVCARNENTGEETTLFTDEEEYISLGGKQKYAYYHTGLSLWNGWLYASSTDTVYAISPDGSEVVEVYHHDTQEEGTYILSSFVKNDTAYLTLSNHDFHYSSLEIPLEASGYHIHSYQHTEIAPTCQEDGLHIYTCDCGISLEMPGENALFHDYKTTLVQKPTLWKKGQEQCCCAACGDTFYRNVSRLTLWEWILELLGIA